MAQPSTTTPTLSVLFGLYARYSKDPDVFRADYDDFLSSTGLADASTSPLASALMFSA